MAKVPEPSVTPNLNRARLPLATRVAVFMLLVPGLATMFGLPVFLLFKFGILEENPLDSPALGVPFGMIGYIIPFWYVMSWAVFTQMKSRLRYIAIFGWSLLNILVGGALTAALFAVLMRD